jgi:DHA1 family bicyclomycin/chloramphenicol resistance-like MFS transporter
MHPQAKTLWRGPRWTLALLLAALSTLAPFAIDAYLPAFGGMQDALQATPVQMQQTLSAFLLALACMNLLHGALSDSVGRRPVVLVSLAAFTLSSIGCALSGSMAELLFFRVLQGLSAGGGMVVGRAVIRDLFPPVDAQRVMSQVTIFFGVAPAVAPLIGGVLFVHLGWRAIFVALALIGAALLVLSWRTLPESLHDGSRQSLRLGSLLRGYTGLLTQTRFLAVVLAAGISFNGMFIYVLAAPAWLGGLLGLAPTQFFWFFVLSVGGVMLGAWFSGRLAGRVTRSWQVGLGFAIMGVATLANVVLNGVLQPDVRWALIPVSVVSFGWSLTAPALTLIALDLVPERRGMASSVQSFTLGVGNALVAGVLAPLVMHAAWSLALGSAVMVVLGALCWLVVRGRVE